MGVKEHMLIQDIATRWNSTYDMMTPLSEQERVISDILLDPTLTKKSDSVLNLTDLEWDLLSDLCEVISVFSDVTTYMSTEKAVSVSEVLPIVFGLINDHLPASIEDRPTVSKVKEVIREDLQHPRAPLGQFQLWRIFLILGTRNYRSSPRLNAE